MDSSCFSGCKLALFCDSTKNFVKKILKNRYYNRFTGVMPTFLPFFPVSILTLFVSQTYDRANHFL
jgi:hypothetical protein